LQEKRRGGDLTSKKNPDHHPANSGRKWEADSTLALTLAGEKSEHAKNEKGTKNPPEGPSVEGEKRTLGDSPFLLPIMRKKSVDTGRDHVWTLKSSKH